MIVEIESYLDSLFPNPKSELNYSKDYEFLIAVVLSSQTTDKRVNSVTSILFSKYSNLAELDNASTQDIVSIIRPIGTFNKKAKFIKGIVSILIRDFNGIVPNDRGLLESFPGVGRKVANVILSELFNIPSIAVDTHVLRVSKRLGIVGRNASVLIVENKLMKLIKKDCWSKRHLQLVLFGRYHCKAVKPLCISCRINKICKYYNK